VLLCTERIAAGRAAYSTLGAALARVGILQYRLIGNYRSREGGGGPGLSIPPQRLVTGGPYRFFAATRCTSGT